MVPAGGPVESTIERSSTSRQGDIVIDGGNSKFSDSLRPRRGPEEAGDRFRGRRDERRSLGLELGYCLMVVLAGGVPAL